MYVCLYMYICIYMDAIFASLSGISRENVQQETCNDLMALGAAYSMVGHLETSYLNDDANADTMQVFSGTYLPIRDAIGSYSAKKHGVDWATVQTNMVLTGLKERPEREQDHDEDSHDHAHAVKVNSDAIMV